MIISKVFLLNDPTSALLENQFARHGTRAIVVQNVIWLEKIIEAHLSVTAMKVIDWLASLILSRNSPLS
jgi:hypothetical protein